MIHSVIGSTQDFDSWSLGSSPNELTIYSDNVMAASQSPKLMVLVRVRFRVQKMKPVAGYHLSIINNHLSI